MRRPSRGPAAPGFTLIEVLVALGIVAITLIAGLKAGASLLDNADRQRTALLAQLCAENELVRLRLTRQMPGVGEHQADCQQGGLTLQLQTVVEPTPNPNFMRVDARVLQGPQQVLQLITIVGRY